MTLPNILVANSLRHQRNNGLMWTRLSATLFGKSGSITKFVIHILKIISSSDEPFRNSKLVDQHSQATAAAACPEHMAAETETTRHLAVVLVVSFSKHPCGYIPILRLIIENYPTLCSISLLLPFFHPLRCQRFYQIRPSFTVVGGKFPHPNTCIY